MTGGSSRDVKAIGVFPTPRVPIRGTDRHVHFLLRGDTYPSDFRGDSGRSEECLERRFETHHFLKSYSRARWVDTKFLPLLGIASKQEDCVPESIDCRVDSSG